MRKLLVLLLLALSIPALAQSPLVPGMTPVSCFVENVTATTQCFVAPVAPFRIYITALILSNEATTAQSIQIVSGTGTNCGTGVAAVTHKIAMVTAIGSVTSGAPTVFVVAPGQAVCVSPTNATAFGASLTGYIAP